VAIETWRDDPNLLAAASVVPIISKAVEAAVSAAKTYCKPFAEADERRMNNATVADRRYSYKRGWRRFVRHLCQTPSWLIWDGTEPVPPGKLMQADFYLMLPTQQILGIRFFDGNVDEAVERMFQNGGFLVAPSGTCFARLRRDAAYRQAVAQADIAIPDSGAMVVFWRLFRGRALTRISGLKYLQHLCARLFAAKSRTLWVLPNERARQKTTEWLRSNQFAFENDDFYVAPMYAGPVQDPGLLATIEERRPEHVIIAVGSGPQEKLGHYLRDHLTYRPAIHCTGAALGFLTGDQIKIPDWADRLYLGWLLRLFAQPRVFIPRLTRAAQLPLLILRYGSEMPPARKD
jgi:exopolysaccharide biosynthesis WecB/TagA/CpsF family protein